MHSKMKVLVGGCLAIALVLANFVGIHSWTSDDFSLGLEWTGITTTNLSAFNVSVTNKALSGSVPNRIQFQWIDKADRLDTCHVALWKRGPVGTAYIGIPADAKKLRILLCDTPSRIRQQVTGIAQKLPPSLNRFLPQKWLNAPDVHRPFAWVANPALSREHH
jgi:hypothetical protein